MNRHQALLVGIDAGITTYVKMERPVIRLPWEALHDPQAIEKRTEVFDRLSVCGQQEMEELPFFCLRPLGHEDKHGWEINCELPIERTM